MKMYKNFILEKATDILYHFTYVSNLSNILKTNTLYLTNSIGTKADKKSKHNYYFSLTRTKSIMHGYGVRFSGNDSVRIMFDGQKLNNNFKVINIDYWNASRDANSRKQSPSLDEMEERIVSNENEIPNINKYIKSIDILNTKKKLSKSIIENAKKLNIKINFFNDEKYFNSGNKNHTVTPLEIDDMENNRSGYFYLVDVSALYIYKDENNKKKLEKLLKKYFNDDKYKLEMNDIIDKSKNLEYKLNINDRDIPLIIESDIHNAKSSTDPVEREILKMLSDDIIKHNISGISEYITYKTWIGKTTQKEFNEKLNKEVLEYIDKKYDELIKDTDKYRLYVDSKELVNYFKIPIINKYLKSVINTIKSYLSDKILSDNEFYKYNYVLTSQYIKNVVDFNKITDIVDGLDIYEDEIKSLIEYFIYDLSSFIEHKVDNIIETHRKDMGWN